ncbi:MAG: thymidine phosphorylase [Gemmataceae bacterium]|nr:thymidine phosphorylase [Gemmataceae bacterium]
MRAVDIIRKKRDGHALEAAEIDAFIAAVTNETWPEYQTSALLMAICWRGMSAKETAHLTHAMVHSGVTLELADIPGPKVDKHSTGGVGDKTSLVLAPLAAACGCIVPMMSGRGLGHSGGTLDKLESIPGFRVHLGLDEFRAALRAVGCALIGQTNQIAPADKKLYALRDVTATVESIPLITASILSKKIAEGIDALVMDVKCGQGAFMKTRADATALAKSIVSTGNANAVRTEAILTAMDVPLGRAVGNALEVRECLDVLRGNGPKDVEDLSVALAARMLVLGKVDEELISAEARIRAALSSGKGLEKLRDIIMAQGGDPRVVDEPERLPRAPHQHLFRAEKPGYVNDIHAEVVGRACMALGAGRDRVEHAIDPSVGILLKAALGDKVGIGDVIAEIHYADQHRLSRAMTLLQQAWSIAEEKRKPGPLIMDVIAHD